MEWGVLQGGVISAILPSPLMEARMLAPNPAVTATWPIDGDAPDLLVIVADQATTIAAQNALIQAYQDVLSAAQAPAPGVPASANGAIVTASTSLPVTGTVGVIAVGAVVTGTTNPVAPTVVGQISGVAGGDGTYLLSAPVTLTAVTLLTFTPPGAPSTWPPPRDATTLNLIVQEQTAVLRVQTALLQHYQDLLNISETPASPTGP